MDGARMVVVDRDGPGGKPQSIYIGELGAPPTERCRRIATHFERAGIPVSLEADIDGWLKYHFAFIGPTAGVVLARGGDFEAVARDAQALRKFQRACREAGNVLARVGYTRRQPFVFNLFYWLPVFLAPWVFRKLFDSRQAEVAFGLHLNAIGSELTELKDEFAVLQGQAGLETPNLDELLAFFPR